MTSGVGESKTAMRYVYSFLPGRVDGHEGLARLVGNKGAQLAEMSRMGLPVPPGFTISAEASGVLRRTGELPGSLRAEVEAALEELGRELGLRFGDPERPLLVSVRSGAPVSMPGMMPTVSNVGLTRATLPGLVGGTNDARFAYDTFRRLIETYARAVIDPATPRQPHRAASVSAALAQHLDRTLGAGREDEDDLSPARLARLCDEYLAVVEKVAGRPFPDRAEEQLWESVNAVFKSWDNRHAVAYRERAGIPHELGTAVTVQAMVFGNLGDASGAGVLFSRDPATGARGVCGEWLPNAQGEDVVGGSVTPYALSAASRARVGERAHTLEESSPAVFRRLTGLAQLLEARYRDAQEIEFVIQEGRVWVLQTRGCKRSRFALARTAVEMAREGLITVGEALERTEELTLDEACWVLEQPVKATPIARGLAASVGVASGVMALTADRAEQFAGEGKDVVFVGDKVAPEDIHGIHAARGLVTNVGGAASHLAVTARGWDKACVVGCGTLRVDAAGGTVRAGGAQLKEGDEVTVDGNGGAVYAGRLARRRGGGEFDDYFAAVREWRRARGAAQGLKAEGFG